MADTCFYSVSLHLSLLSLTIMLMVKPVSLAPVSLVSSGDESDIKNSSPVSLIAKIITEEAGELYKELCNTPNLCGSSMERNLKLELKLPQITDRCLSKDFHKDQCLHKIHRDLLRFQVYFTFLKKSLESKKETVESMQHKTKTLAEAVKNMEKQPHEETEDNDTDISLEDLQSKDAWNEKLTTYLILQSFKDYMIKTTRAIRNSSG